MRKFLIAVLFMLPAVGVVGCQQDASVQSDIANLKREVGELRSENERLNNELTGDTDNAVGTDEIGPVLARLESYEQELEAANKRIAELEKKPAATIDVTADGDGEAVVANDEEYDKFKALQDRYREERDAARRAEQQERMTEMAKIAEENGLEFDPENPRESIMKIMSDPTKRAKAMEVMRSEMTKRRLEPLNLDEYQTKEVLRIEEEGRTKMRDAVNAARERGATQEEIQREIEIVQEDQKRDLEGVLTPEQMEEYEESGANWGGMIPGGGMGGFGGMIPGFGGGNGG